MKHNLHISVSDKPQRTGCLLYTSTSITGGTLVVKPKHSVFVNNVAQIRVTTSENDVYDTLTISKIYDGAKGDKCNPGSAGTGGLSVVLGNEAQTIACTSEGKTSAASTISIPFTGYVGIMQTACTCAVGTLPTGITVKINTAATASATAVSYTHLPSIESETKEDTIEPGTEKLSLTADPREDGLVKSRTGDTTTDATYNDWYKAVYVPVAKTASASSASTGGK